MVVQADSYNLGERHVTVAEITSNLSRAAAADPAHLPIEVGTAEGQATGLAHDSLVTCLHLGTISGERITGIIGKLSTSMLVKVNDCLKADLEVP